MNIQHIVLQDVLDNVGMQIYYYLHPKDLFSLGSCSRHLRNDVVHSKLDKICIHHLPLQLGAATNYLAEFREGHSFSDKEELLNHVLDKTEAAKLVLVDTRTVKESRSRAREVLLLGNDYKSTAKFHALHDKNDNLIALPTTVECYYQNGIEKRSAISWANYNLDRDACKRNGADKETYQFIQAWLNCIFSRNDNRTFGMWRWSCKHRDLNGHGIAGVGVMITSTTTTLLGADAEGANNSTTIMEVRLTRKY